MNPSVSWQKVSPKARVKEIDWKGVKARVKVSRLIQNRDAIGFGLCIIRENSGHLIMEMERDPNPEGQIAGKVLDVVVDTRLEGLASENRRLVQRNTELITMCNEAHRRCHDLTNRVQAQASVIQRFRRQNGSYGSRRRELNARHHVCAFCYEALAVGRSISCRCRRFSHCSRECKNLHWYRRHQFNCRAPRSEHPEPPSDDE